MSKPSAARQGGDQHAGCSLPPAYEAVARDELGETAEKREGCLRELRAALARTRPSGTAAALDADNDSALLAFLRPCKFDVDKAARRIASWSAECARHPRVFDRDSTDGRSVVDEIVRKGGFSALGSRDNNWRMVALASLAEIKPVHYGQVARAAMQVIDLFIADPRNQVAGVVLVGDLAGFSWSHVLHLPVHAITCIKLWQAGYPVRVKAVRLVNVPAVFSTFWLLVRPFLREKYQRLIHLYKADPADRRRFAEECDIAEESLPGELGGRGPPVADSWAAFYQRFVEFYADSGNTRWLVRSPVTEQILPDR